jgi:hypothetical protein
MGEFGTDDFNFDYYGVYRIRGKASVWIIDYHMFIRFVRGLCVFFVLAIGFLGVDGASAAGYISVLLLFHSVPLDY